MMIRKTAVQRQRVRGSRDGVFGFRVLLLPLNEAGRLASADAVVFGSLLRSIVTIVGIVGKGRSFEAFLKRISNPCILASGITRYLNLVMMIGNKSRVKCESCINGVVHPATLFS